MGQHILKKKEKKICKEIQGSACLCFSNQALSKPSKLSHPYFTKITVEGKEVQFQSEKSQQTPSVSSAQHQVSPTLPLSSKLAPGSRCHEMVMLNGALCFWNSSERHVSERVGGPRHQSEKESWFPPIPLSFLLTSESSRCSSPLINPQNSLSSPLTNPNSLSVPVFSRRGQTRRDGVEAPPPHSNQASSSRQDCLYLLHPLLLLATHGVGGLLSLQDKTKENRSTAMS